MKSVIVEAWDFFINQMSAIGITDFIDIAIVSVLIYYIFRFVRERRAAKLAIGVMILFVIQLMSSVFDFVVLGYLLRNILQVGLIAAVIIFQPELRSILERVGGDSLKGLRSIVEDKDDKALAHFVDELSEAVNEMSMSKTGALIVLERTTKLGDVISTGTLIDAQMTSMLLRNIFFNKSPLHDGAVVIRDMKIHSAGCLLPLAIKSDITKELGTRHRAALGISEASDALVIVVSDETGIVSIANKGTLKRGYDMVKLKMMLNSVFGDSSSSKKKIRKKKDKKLNNGNKK